MYSRTKLFNLIIIETINIFIKKLVVNDVGHAKVMIKSEMNLNISDHVFDNYADDVTAL